MPIVKQFTFAKEKTPQWFTDECSAGRAKVNYDFDNKIVNAVLFTPSGKVIVNPGDTIMMTRTGFVVLNPDVAKKYKIQQEPKNEKEI